MLSTIRSPKTARRVNRYRSHATKYYEIFSHTNYGHLHLCVACVCGIGNCVGGIVLSLGIRLKLIQILLNGEKKSNFQGYSVIVWYTIKKRVQVAQITQNAVTFGIY